LKSKQGKKQTIYLTVQYESKILHKKHRTFIVQGEVLVDYAIDMNVNRFD